MNNTQPLSRAELAEIKRGQARDYCIDQLRRVTSGLNAALDSEPNSTRSAALHSIRARVASMITELKVL